MLHRVDTHGNIPLLGYTEEGLLRRRTMYGRLQSVGECFASDAVACAVRRAFFDCIERDGFEGVRN